MLKSNVVPESSETTSDAAADNDQLDMPPAKRPRKEV